MTTATNDATKALPPKDFLVKDYEYPKAVVIVSAF